MVVIVSETHGYVPAMEYTAVKTIHSTGEEVPISDAVFHHTFFGGDQLTAARIRSAQKHVCNADTPIKRLEGVHAMIEDWHTKLTFMEVSTAAHFVTYTTWNNEFICSFNRLYGSTFIQQNQDQTTAPFTN